MLLMRGGEGKPGSWGEGAEGRERNFLLLWLFFRKHTIASDLDFSSLRMQFYMLITVAR